MPDNEGQAFTKPNQFNELHCGICGDKMIVTRGIDGPTSWSMSMAKKKRLHDSFTCPNLEAAWHVQAKAILEKSRKTPSKILTDLLREEADSILKTRCATKIV